MISNERGFTLVEMLLVLLIVAILTTVIGHYSYHYAIERKMSDFTDTVQNDLYAAQAQSKAEQRYMNINFYEHYYEVRRGIEQLSKTPYPEGVVFNTNLPTNQISYTSAGTSQRGATLVFHSPLGELRLIIYLGSGRQVWRYV